MLVGTRRVGNHNAAPRELGEVDVVKACAVAGDHAQLGQGADGGGVKVVVAQNEHLGTLAMTDYLRRRERSAVRVDADLAARCPQALDGFLLKDTKGRGARGNDELA